MEADGIILVVGKNLSGQYGSNSDTEIVWHDNTDYSLQKGTLNASFNQHCNYCSCR